jgi:ClpP class serine protease
MHWGNFQAATSAFNWLIFGFLLLQPVLKHRMLVAAREKAFREMEAHRKSRVIALIHRKEVVNFLGFPVVQFLDIQESEAILRAIRLTPRDQPIDLILHTPAGVSLAAEQIARALSRRSGKVTVFVPHYALCGGTLLALTADELVMCPDAILGAVDPTIGKYPAAAVLSVTTKKRPEQMSDETFLLVDQAGKAVNQMQSLLANLLQKRMEAAQAQQLAETLTRGRWTQDYPISVEELRELGFTVSTEMPEDVLRLMNLYPQDSRRRPSVDFIPLPYSTPKPPAVAPDPQQAKSV